MTVNRIALTYIDMYTYETGKNTIDNRVDLALNNNLGLCLNNSCQCKQT